MTAPLPEVTPTPSPDGPEGTPTAVISSAGLPPPLPVGGETLGDFRLLTELGRGAQGHVFLATQPALANRPVVLKFGPCAGQEHLSLAKLQHASIVPLFGALDDDVSGQRVLCMPYYGSTTLAHLMRGLADKPLADRTGRDLLAVLDRAEAAAPLPDGAVDNRGPGRERLQDVSFARAIAWVGACLANALQHAHERGLLHLDLKPSNVLIAADGTPMLLDFHLARPPVEAGKPTPEGLGGTFSFMPFEQREALEALRHNRPAPRAVDARADVYALGALLYQALGGSLPFVAGASPPLYQINPQVDVGLSDVVARCLAPDPKDRYQSAAAVEEDLARHLGDRPLVGVPNRSLRERWFKWRRRKPHALGLILLGLTVVIAAGTSALVGYRTIERSVREARERLAAGQASLNDQRLEEALEALTRALATAQGMPGTESLQRQIQDSIQEVRRRMLVRDLRRVADGLRRLYPFEGRSETELRALAMSCRQIWEARDRIERQTDPDSSVGRDLLDVAVLGGELRVRVAAPGQEEAARGEALQLLDEAERRFGTNAVLAHQRELLAHPSRPPSDVDGPAPRTAWELAALGRSWLRLGRPDRAWELLREAVRREPQGLWPNFYAGQCAYRRRDYHEAEARFSVCVGAAPGVAECLFNRARAAAKAERAEAALDDYTSALKLDPDLVAAYEGRGLLYFQLKKYDEAETDLHGALAKGGNSAALHYNLALVLLAKGERGDALASARRALERDPQHSGALELCERLQGDR